MTYTSGNHTFKFGTDINRVRDIDDNLFTGSGSYTYSNINDFIVDYTNFVTNGALRTAVANFAPITRPRILPADAPPQLRRQMPHKLGLPAGATPATTLRVSVSRVSS